MEPLAWSTCEPFETTVNSVAARFAGRSGTEFDDLVQEGWECVVAKLRASITPTEEDIERWVRSYIRQAERLHKGDTCSPLVFGGTPTKPAIQMDIWGALRGLPPELQTVALMYGFGYNHAEIGLQVGIHRNTVRVWLADATIRLRRLL